MPLDTIRDLASLLGQFLTPVIGWGVYELRKINAHLATLNGRVTRMEQQVVDHDANDKREFADLKTDLREMRAQTPARGPH